MFTQLMKLACKDSRFGLTAFVVKRRLREAWNAALIAHRISSDADGQGQWPPAKCYTLEDEEARIEVQA